MIRTRLPRSRPRISAAVIALAVGAALVVTSLPAAAGGQAPPGPVERIDVDDPVALAVEASRRAHPDDLSAFSATVATTNDFADAMAGSSLAASGPVLLTGPDALDDRVATELQRLVEPGSPVRILGGVAALSEQVAADLQALGYEVRRLAGETRIETAVAIAAENDALVGAPTRYLLARAFAAEGNPTSGWADAISAAVPAGANGWSILLTASDSLSAPTAERLGDGVDVTILGGTTAVSAAVEAQVAATNPVTRLSGTARDGTAARIATELMGVGPQTVPRTVLAYDGWAEDGWARGLAAAQLGVDREAPLLPLNTQALAQGSAGVIACGPAQAAVIAIGSTATLPDATVAAHQTCPTGAPLELRGDGLGIGLPFGTPAEEAISRLIQVLGPPVEDSGWVEGCPLDGEGVPNERSVVYPGDLTARFYDDGAQTLSGWRYAQPDGAGLRTPEGIGPSSTNAEVAAAYPDGTLEDSKFGPMWLIPYGEDGRLVFFPADLEDPTPIDLMYAGSPLFCE